MLCLNDHPNRDKVIMMLLGVDRLTNEHIDIMKCIPYKVLIRSLVIADSDNGMSTAQIALKYRVTDRQIRWILDDSKVIMKN